MERQPFGLFVIGDSLRGSNIDGINIGNNNIYLIFFLISNERPLNNVYHEIKKFMLININ